ncbi:MAG: CapA family protein [Clostridiales bacterium]|nr:CapA family protein [Clostridiales bacterium]
MMRQNVAYAESGSGVLPETASGAGTGLVREESGREENDRTTNETVEGDVLSRIESETGGAYEENNKEEDNSRYGAVLADAAGMQAMNAVEVESGADGSVTVTFAGDILFDDSYSPMVRLKQRGGDITSCFSADLMEEMRKTDVFMLNNEFTYTDRGTPTPEKQYTFRAKPSHVSYLKDLSVDVVSLANNHAYDYGEVSLTDTLDTLTEAGIPYVGAGRNLEEASKPLYLMTKDLKIALISATQIERQDNPNTKGATGNTPGVFRCWNPEKLYETIAQAKQESDFVIVYIHWGTENTTDLDWAQREQAAGIVEAGADLIIGNHPHCLQEIGYVDGVPVIYSLGNYWFNSRALDTCLVKAVVTPQGLESLRFVPARQENCYTKLLTGTEAARVIGYMNTLSDTAVLDETGLVAPKP